MTVFIPNLVFHNTGFYKFLDVTLVFYKIVFFRTNFILFTDYILFSVLQKVNKNSAENCQFSDNK